MTAILVKAIADLRRRRVQAVVIFVTVLLSIGTGTMAVTLMSQTRDPYQTAFQAQKGAHLQVTFNPKTDPKLLAATPAAIGASAFGGPYLATGLEFKYGDRKYYQHTWVLPAAIPALTTPDSRFYAMDYGFHGDPTSSQLAGYVDRLRASLPPGSISGSVNYLLIRSIFNITNQILTGVLSAFSVFALVATIAIVAVLVTGIVISAYREIGIMKALGFTPAGVTGVFTLQIVIPALAACLLGIPAGTLVSQPLLANSSHALGLPYTPSFSISLDLLILVAGLLVVVVAASLPALRAGLLKPITAITNATAPRGGSGRRVRRQEARLGLPRPVILGIGDAFARPLRA